MNSTWETVPCGCCGRDFQRPSTNTEKDRVRRCHDCRNHCEARNADPALCRVAGGREFFHVHRWNLGSPNSKGEVIHQCATCPESKVVVEADGVIGIGATRVKNSLGGGKTRRPDAEVSQAALAQRARRERARREKMPEDPCGAVHPESPSTHCERPPSHGGPHRCAGVIWERVFSENRPVPEIVAPVEPGDPGIATIPTMATAPERLAPCDSSLPSLWKDGERVQCQKKAGHDGDHRYEAATWGEGLPTIPRRHEPASQDEVLRAKYLAVLIDKAVSSGDPGLLDRVERLLGLGKITLHDAPPGRTYNSFDADAR